MQENGFLSGIFHDFLCYFVWCQLTDTLFPNFIRLTHRYPYVCINHISIFCSLFYIFCQCDGGTCLSRIAFAELYQLLVREVFACCACDKVHTHFCTGDHQRIAHVESCIAHIYQLSALQITEMLADGQKVCQHLCRMILVCQSVPYRHACVFCQLLYDFLAKSAVFNSLVHSSQDTSSILNAFFLADLRT